MSDPVASLLNQWYPIAFSRQVRGRKLVALKLFERPLVLFRDESRKIHCLLDACPHRSVPLSIGRHLGDRIECVYHGWQVNPSGTCIHIPTLPSADKIPKQACVPQLPAREVAGMILVWPGEPALAESAPLPGSIDLAAKRWRAVDGVRKQNVGFELVVENLIDPAHFPYTHRRTLARRRVSKDLAIKRRVEGNLIVGEVNMPMINGSTLKSIEFEGPCEVRLVNAMPLGWSLVQQFFCVPETRHTTRMLWRVWRSFWRGVPGLDLFIRLFSNTIISQDNPVLHGQAERLRQGAQPYKVPVPTDALTLAYRNWYRENVPDDVWTIDWQSRAA